MNLYKNKYYYFVSYSHERGFGCIEINLSEPKIKSQDQVINVGKYITEKFMNGKEVCILNFILIRTEIIWFWQKEFKGRE